MNASARTLKCRPCLKSLSPEEVLARASWSPQDKPTSYGIVTVNGELKSRPAVALLVRFHSLDDAVSPQMPVHPAESGERSASEAFYEMRERTLQEAP
jgi:hypothetical protein